MPAGGGLGERGRAAETPGAETGLDQGGVNGGVPRRSARGVLEGRDGFVVLPELRQGGAEMDRQADEIGRLESRNAGKPVGAAIDE